MSAIPPAAAPQPISRGCVPALAVSALGTVFGDIGTSPLDTLKTVLNLAGRHPAPTTTVGILAPWSS